MKITIIIPAKNEEKRIEEKLSAFAQYFDEAFKESETDYEIIVVLNNSTDNTEKIVRSLQKKHYKIRCLCFEEGGKGFAIIEGFKDALARKNDLIGFVDADMSTVPAEYWKLVKELPEYDGTIASRYIEGSRIIPSLSLKRKIVSRVFNLVVRTLFRLPYHDTQCGAKLFTRDAVQKILPQLSITQWAIDIDLLYNLKKNGFIIKEVPTIWYNVEGSTLKVGKASIQMFFAVFQLRLIESPFRFVVRFIKPIVSIIYRNVK